MGGLVHFPRSATRHGESEGQHSAEDVFPVTRNTSEISLVTWIDAKRSRDGDDDGGGGRAA